MLPEEYKPYTEWWEDTDGVELFVRTIMGHLSCFEDNMLGTGFTGERTRQEWMEMFLLWMEYKK